MSRTITVCINNKSYDVELTEEQLLGLWTDVIEADARATILDELDNMISNNPKNESEYEKMINDDEFIEEATRIFVQIIQTDDELWCYGPRNSITAAIDKLKRYTDVDV